MDTSGTRLDMQDLRTLGNKKKEAHQAKHLAIVETDLMQE